MSVTDQSGGKSQEVSFTSSCGIPKCFSFNLEVMSRRLQTNCMDRAVQGQSSKEVEAVLALV